MGTKNLKFHQDNARAHSTKSTLTYPEASKLAITHHPPYSHLLIFSYSVIISLVLPIIQVKKVVKLRKFPKYANRYPELNTMFGKWIETMKLCIIFGGDLKIFEIKEKNSLCFYYL